MADSDDEYDRKRRDKFRGERAEASYRGAERVARPRDEWSERETWPRPRPREYRNPRDRGYSPGMEPAPKRIRHDFYGDNYYNHYSPYHHPTHREPPQNAQAEGQQPPMMSFKAFLATQDDNISDSEAIEKYNDYKLEFQRQQLNEFFVAHKDDEWFRMKYHPEDSVKRKEEQMAALKKRVEVFLDLLNTGKIANVSVDIQRTNDLLKLLDTVVIKLEGGTDEDVALMEKEYTDIEEKAREALKPQPAQSEATVEPSSDKNKDVEIVEKKNGDSEEKNEDQEAKTNGEATEELTKKSESENEDDSKKNNEDKAVAEEEEEEEKKDDEKECLSAAVEESNEKMDVDKKEEDPNQEGVKEINAKDEEMEDVKEKAEDEANEKKEEKETANKRKRTYSGSSSGSHSSASDDESKKEDKEDDEEVKKEDDNDNKENDNTDGAEKGEEEAEKIETIEDDKPEKPRALHKTTSIFLRNLAPTITKQEVEAMCSRYEGFLRVALADPQPERRWLRRGWVTFKRDANIKEICWNLNNIRLRECELGAIVNRDLSRRIRPVNGITAHKQVVRSDIRISAKVALHLDSKAGLWPDNDEEKKKERAQSFGLVSNNPVLHNITDYLIEEASAEEEELLGLEPASDTQDTASTVERDDNLISVLDKIILYLRIVHSVDYYNHCEYPNEDEMPNRCGILHARGPPPTSKTDMTQFIGAAVESKMANFLPEKPREEANKNEAKLINLSLKDEDTEVDKFVQANTRELAKDKWLCPLSGKKFKGPDFVRKHIFNKHSEKIEEVKKEVEFFNNYLRDPKRPMLAEAPQPKREEPPAFNHPTFGGGYGGYGRPPPFYNQGFGQRTRGFAPRTRGTPGDFGRPRN